MTQTDSRALSRWISDDLCAGGQPINAMLEHVFLWCRDRRIYGPSRKELARFVRSQRHPHMEAQLGRDRARLATGREACRGRVCLYVVSSVVAQPLNNKP